jgi:hypothetical protein
MWSRGASCFEQRNGLSGSKRGGDLLDELDAVSLAIMPSHRVGLDDVERENSTKFCIVCDYVMCLVRE